MLPTLKKSRISDDEDIEKIAADRKYAGAHMMFTPVHLRKEPLTLQDLFTSENLLTEYMESQQFPIQETDKIAQLSPIGLALLANYYNDKGDQKCPIYVASLCEDLLSIVKKANSFANGVRLVVIFQPTDVTDRDIWFHTIHKTVVYLEKKDDLLHIVNADGVHFSFMEDYIEQLAKQALPDIKFAYYKREPILNPENKSWLHLQTSYTQCGTYAMRLARKMAKCDDFFDDLIYIESEQPDKNMRVFRYKLPISFAVNASSTIMRNQLLTMYEGHVDRSKLVVHFEKYKEKGSYGCKFSEKYIAMGQDLLSETSQDELLTRIDNANARNFRL